MTNNKLIYPPSKVHASQVKSSQRNASSSWLNSCVHLTTNDKIKQHRIDFNKPICLNLTNNFNLTNILNLTKNFNLTNILNLTTNFNLSNNSNLTNNSITNDDIKQRGIDFNNPI